jgi:glucokinase
MMTNDERLGGPLFVGLDMGGTDIKATVSDGAGAILVDTPDKILSLAAEGPRQTVEQLATAAARALERAALGERDVWGRVVCVGLDTPGPATVDGVIARSPNLVHPDWDGFPVRAALEERLGRPVLYANDGNAAGYWEYYRLFGDSEDRIVAAAILGTGLGGALVWGGRLLVGARGYGGEFGHIRLPTHELLEPGEEVPRCGCGQLACAEAFVSVAALDGFLRRALARPEHRDHPLQALPDLPERRNRALRLLTLAQQGDALAQRLFDRQADALGALFIQLANCCDPDVLVIGGGITESSAAFRERYLGRVREVFRRGAFPLAADETRFEYARDQDMAGARGSALLARRFARARGLSG